MPKNKKLDSSDDDSEIGESQDDDIQDYDDEIEDESDQEEREVDKAHLLNYESDESDD